MKYLLVSFLSVLMIQFLSSMTLANTNPAAGSFSGEWQGWGDWTYEGSGDHCDMYLTLSDSTTQFIRQRGQFNCTVVGLTIPQEAFLKNGKNLMLNQQVVGQINGDHVEFHEAYNPAVNVTTTMTVSARHLDYEEVWTQKDGAILYRIKGRLFKHQ
jgi:hypothetical protein